MVSMGYRALFAGLFATGCDVGRGADQGDECVDVRDLLKRGGAPSIRMEIDGEEALLDFDSGWRGLTLSKEAFPDVQEVGGSVPDLRLWGDVRVPTTQLVPVSVAVGTRRTTVHKPRRRLSHDESRVGLAGVVGVEVYAGLGGVLAYTPQEAGAGRVCFSGPSCPTPTRAWTVVEVGGQELQGFVDTGVRETTILARGVSASTLTLPGGVEIVASVPTPFMSNRLFGSRTMDGRVADVVLGWMQLRSIAWTWDLCSGTISFAPGTASRSPPATRPG